MEAPGLLKINKGIKVIVLKEGVRVSTAEQVVKFFVFVFVWTHSHSCTSRNSLLLLFSDGDNRGKSINNK